MSVIWTSRTRTQQPQTTPSLTTAPIGRGLFTLFDPKSGIDVATRQRLFTAVTVPPTRAVPPSSLGAYTQGARHELRRQLLNQPLAADDFTISATFVSYSYVALSGLFGWGYQSGTPLQSPTVGSLRGLILNDGAYYFWGYGFDWSTGVTVDVDARQRTVTVTRSGSTMRLYNNGVQVATTSTPALVDVIAGSYVVMGNGHNSAAAAPDATILQGAGWARALAADEVLQHARNPWQLYANDRRRIYFDAAASGGAAALEGSLAASATVSGALTTAIKLAGSVSGSATVSAALTTGIPLAASLSGSATVAGALTTAIQLAGSLSGTASVTGDISGAAALASSVSASAIVTGDLSTAIRLNASISGSATVTGVLAEPGAAAALAGELSLSATVSASLTGGSSTIWTPVSASSGTWTPASASSGTWVAQ